MTLQYVFLIFISGSFLKFFASAGWRNKRKGKILVYRMTFCFCFCLPFQSSIPDDSDLEVRLSTPFPLPFFWFYGTRKLYERQNGYTDRLVYLNLPFQTFSFQTDLWPCNVWLLAAFSVPLFGSTRWGTLTWKEKLGMDYFFLIFLSQSFNSRLTLTIFSFILLSLLPLFPLSKEIRENWMHGKMDYNFCFNLPFSLFKLETDFDHFSLFSFHHCLCLHWVRKWEKIGWKEKGVWIINFSFNFPFS